MSVSTFPVIMDRIETARPGSAIAVFQHPKRGLLNALFADTVATRAAIERGVGLVGVYDNTMSKADVKGELMVAASKSTEAEAA